MGNLLSFDELVEAADNLNLDEQETLVEILQGRWLERRQKKILEEVQKS